MATEDHFPPQRTELEGDRFDPAPMCNECRNHIHQANSHDRDCPHYGNAEPEAWDPEYDCLGVDVA